MHLQAICRYLIFSLESGKSIILDREQAVEEGSKILQDHAITMDRSSDIEDLRPKAAVDGAHEPAPDDDQGNQKVHPDEDGENEDGGRNKTNGMSVDPPSTNGR